MKVPSLLRHGERINQVYFTTLGAPRGAGKRTEEERPDGEVSGIVKRYKKGESASSNFTALGLIKASHLEAIEYTGIATHVRGLIIFWGVFGAAVMIFLGQLGLPELIVNGVRETFDIVQIFFACLFIGLGFYFLLSAVRMEFFRPADEPVIFDRKNRKVYRLFREVHPGLFGLFKRWHIYASEYDWNLIDAEHNAVLTATGSTAMRFHSLQFVVRKSESDATIIDSFPIGNTIQLGELSVPPLWEHIRRFMEEGGPHLPPGEEVVALKRPLTLWESWVEVGPVGPSYTRMWKSIPVVMVFYHLLFPLSIPLFFIWGIFNWLSHVTSTPVMWPQAVIDAIET